MVWFIEYKDFVIDKIESGYRVTRICDNLDFHTHLKSKSACESVINNVVNKKIPKNVGEYYLTSLIRLSSDDTYKNKIQELIDVRKSKGKKQNYFNPHKK